MVIDGKILCGWNKPYFAISDFNISHYSVPNIDAVTWWMRMTTKKIIKAAPQQSSIIDEDEEEEEEDIDLDMTCLTDFKPMESSIIALDKRDKFSKMKYKKE